MIPSLGSPWSRFGRATASLSQIEIGRTLIEAELADNQFCKVLFNGNLS